MSQGLPEGRPGRSSPSSSRTSSSSGGSWSACGAGSSCRSRGRKGGSSSRGGSRRQGAPPVPSSPVPGMTAPGGRSPAAGAASWRTGESCSLLPSWGWKRKRQEHWGQVAITECAGARSGGKGRLKPQCGQMMFMTLLIAERHQPCNPAAGGAGRKRRCGLDRREERDYPLPYLRGVTGSLRPWQHQQPDITSGAAVGPAD